jgi:hypothetical protein
LEYIHKLLLNIFLESSYQSVSNCLDKFATQLADKEPEEVVNASTFQGIA